MRLIFLTFVLSLPLAYLFGEEEYARLKHIEAISKAPGFAPATFEEIVQAGSKNRSSFRARFRYEVNGQQYRVTTSQTDQAGALAYAAQKEMQVAYSASNPSVGMIKRYYDLRNPQDTLVRSLTVTTLLALGLALPIALGISWRLGWLRRSKKQ